MSSSGYSPDNEQIATPPLRRSVDDEVDTFETDPTVPPQPARVGCSKGCLYGLVGCGCLTVILAVVSGFAVFGFLKNSLTTDPAAVLAATGAIADFPIPVDLKPAYRADLKIVKVAGFISEDRRSALIVSQFDSRLLPANAKTKFELQEHREWDFEVIKSELREMQVRGQPGKVKFSEAKNTKTGAAYRLIEGQFRGKLGPAQFELQIPEEQFQEDDVLKFIGGIR